MEKGKFIVIEGGEGAGKTTIIERLKKELSFEKTVFTREPGGTKLGEKLRGILNYGEEKISVATEILMFSAARMQLVTEVIAPSLEAGKNVISDRFALSTFAYQVFGKTASGFRYYERHLFEMINNEIVQMAKPDLYILLDVSPEIGLKRAAERNEKATRFEKENMEFHIEVRRGYHEGIKKLYPHKIIDSEKPIDEVYKEVLFCITELVVKEALNEPRVLDTKHPENW